MTQSELEYEYMVILETRLALLCEDRDPTPAQVEIATQEARAHLRALNPLAGKFKALRESL